MSGLTSDELLLGKKSDASNAPTSIGSLGGSGLGLREPGMLKRSQATNLESLMQEFMNEQKQQSLTHISLSNLPQNSSQNDIPQQEQNNLVKRANQQNSSLFGAPASGGTGGGGLFGGAGSGGTAPTGQGGLFGQAAQGSGGQGSAGGLTFGSAAAAATTQQPSLFGGANQSQANQPAAAGGLFGQANQPAGGGLFGGGAQQQQQPAGQGTSLFGGQTTQQTSFQSPQKNLFGCSAQPQGLGGAGAGAGTGLFGNKPAGTGTGLFGGAQQQQVGAQPGGLFGGGAGTQQQSAGGGLFGQQTGLSSFGAGAQAQPSGGLFGQAQQPQNQMGQTQSGILQSMNPYQFHIDQNATDLTQTLQSFMQVLHPQQNQNKFVAHFYDKYQAQFPKEMKKILQTSIPYQTTSKDDTQDQPLQCPSNIPKWIKAMEANPNKNDYYITQVNSYADLKDRVNVTQETLKKLNARLTTVKETLNKTQQTCDTDLQSQIYQSRLRNEAIMKKLIVVFGKFEELLCMDRGRGIMRAEHEALNDQYNETQHKIDDPQRGLLKKLRQLQQKVYYSNQDAQELEEFQLPYGFKKENNLEVGDDLNNEDLRELVNILKKEKEGLIAIQDSVTMNARQLMVMDKELNSLV
eukprot:403370023